MKRLLPLAAFLLTLPGCIAWEIRDEVHATNQHLCKVTPALGHTLHAVEETNRQIAATNARLDDVQASIALVQARMDAVRAELRQIDDHLVAVTATLGTTNPKLNDLDDGLVKMKILNDVHATLKGVDAALAPLSKTMGSLGSAASFLGLSDGSKDLLADEDAATPAAGGAPADAKPGTKAAGEPVVAESPATGDAAKRPDIILGTWVLVYPPPAPPQSTGRIVVISADGRFIAAENNRPPDTGRWTRKGRVLTYQFDASSAPGITARSPEVADLLTLNARTLTTRRGDVVHVYARP